jgi:ribosome-binding protein aMBF1 (putative translation factor)
MARKTLIRCIGEEVRDRRKALGFSQIALAHEAEIHPNVVGRLERGEYNPTIALLEQLIKPLCVALSDLIAGAERRCSF